MNELNPIPDSEDILDTSEITLPVYDATEMRYVIDLLADGDQPQSIFFQNMHGKFDNLSEAARAELLDKMNQALRELLPEAFRPGFFVSGRASSLNSLVLAQVMGVIRSAHPEVEKINTLYAAGSYQDSHFKEMPGVKQIKVAGEYGVFDTAEIFDQVVAAISTHQPTVVVIEFPSLWGAVNLNELGKMLSIINRIVEAKDAQDLLYFHIDAARGLNGLATHEVETVAEFFSVLPSFHSLNVSVVATFRKILGTNTSLSQVASPVDKQTQTLEGGIVASSSPSLNKALDVTFQNPEVTASLEAILSYIFLLQHGVAEARRMNQLAQQLRTTLIMAHQSLTDRYAEAVPFSIPSELPHDTNAVFIRVTPDFLTFLNTRGEWSGTVKPWTYQSGVETPSTESSNPLVRFMTGYTHTADDILRIAKYFQKQAMDHIAEQANS